MSAEQRVGKVYALLQQRRVLDREIDRAIGLAWPVGSKVTWRKTGRHVAFGEVVGYVGGGVQVINAASGKDVRITPHHIALAQETEA